MLVSYGEDSMPASSDEHMEEERQITKATSSCELRVYEWMFNECWKTIRRLVLSSSPTIAEPWCISYCVSFLPRLPDGQRRYLYEV